MGQRYLLVNIASQNYIIIFSVVWPYLLTLNIINLLFLLHPCQNLIDPWLVICNSKISVFLGVLIKIFTVRNTMSLKGMFLSYIKTNNQHPFVYCFSWSIKTKEFYTFFQCTNVDLYS